MQTNITKEQFNKQAENFANWQIGRNTEYLQAYFNFCNIQPNDIVLDVACGPGEFTIFIAKRVLKAHGIDISDKEIEIAKGMAHQFGLDNIHFDCGDVENLPYADGSFSVVVCKSAFHHFTNPDMIFSEMIRCSQNNGRISIQDIVAFEDSYINDYFEVFDKLVDISHNKTLTHHEFNNLYINNNIQKTGEFSLTVDLNVDEYIEHAKQSERNKIKISELLKDGENDVNLNDYFFYKEGKLYFKRPVYLIIGKK
jgi:ubiquinone/menaquinone biosynthesis C-methylase UbiE